MDVKKLLMCDHVKPYLLKARYGIERESQRVNLLGKLATTNHPDSLLQVEFHPYIQRDFSETQIELITPVTNTLDELFNYLAAIHDVAFSSIGPDEMLWPLSMPPELPKNEEDIIIANLSQQKDVSYRHHLSRIYGRRKQMISGVHFNFEFENNLLQLLFESQHEIKDFQLFKNEIYLKVSRNYLKHRWLITYLYGASISSEENFFEENFLHRPIRSIRNSQFGYGNHPEVQVSYESLDTYTSNISEMVLRGILQEDKEFYSAVRLRGTDLKNQGIQYIEIRNLDLNPFEAYGISYEQGEFIHLFLLYLLWIDEENLENNWVKLGDDYNHKVALEHPLEPTQFLVEAHQILNEMEDFVCKLGLEVSPSLFTDLKSRLDNPNQTLAGRLYEAIKQSTQHEVATDLAQKYYHKAWDKPYQLTGFTDMELSTQILMFDAIQYGVQLDVLDRQDQFLKLQLANRIEYVKNGNMTSKDTYVSPLMMANKTVTKKILHQHGFCVPQGDEFNQIDDALAAYPLFSNKPIVIKPKSTNFGLGISIFKDGASLEDYQQAITIAFNEDSSILVEEFLVGTEYRFFVLDDKVQAVLLRVPANVVGDGIHTIKELVTQKNQDVLRGSDHRTPLELIQLGEVEELMLKTQGYEMDSIPSKETIVYLRENSNVSTGGDSIDMTDQIPDDYKRIAVEAVKALGAKISGIDLIIKDFTVPATEKNAYGIIEANFNPSMYMHIHPYQGKSRRLTTHVLHYLFPELQNSAG